MTEPAATKFISNKTTNTQEHVLLYFYMLQEVKCILFYTNNIDPDWSMETLNRHRGVDQ